MPPLTLVAGSRLALEDRLAEEVLAQRARDPLAPLPIVVGGTLMRPHLRRRLAELTGAHLNVRLITVGELGLLLGLPNLVQAGRKPLPFLADRVLAQQVALDHEGYFAPVKAMPGFPSILLRTLRDLRTSGISADDLAAAAVSDDPTDKLVSLASLYADHEHRRAGFFSSDDGLTVAEPSALRADRLLLYGVWDPSALLLQALETTLRELPVTVLLPSTDGATESATRRWSAWADARDATHEALSDAPAPPTVQLVSAPDPAREIQEVVRACLRWAQDDVPFHEMAVVYRHSEPYRPLLEAAFREASIPTYLHEGTPLTERPLGRRIAALLDLVDADLERSTVMTFLADARLPTETWERYGKVSAAGWDTDSRRAGIVRGAQQWQDRLAAAHADLTARAGGDGAPSWLQERLLRIEALQSFITDLDQLLTSRRERASWQEHLAWLRSLLTTYVADAAEVVDALTGLAALDTLADDLPFGRFRDAVVSALEGLRAADVLDARAGAFGVRGVNLLDANTARHLGFTAVAVVGIAERSFPPPPRQDALLLDEEREALNAAHGWSLPLRTTGADPEPLQFAVICDAAERQLQLSVPRAQDGDTRPVLPSTFMLDAAAAKLGRPVRVNEFEQAADVRVRAGRLAPVKPEDAFTELGYVQALLESGDPLGTALLRRRLPRYDRVRAAEDAHWTRTYGPQDGVLSPAAAALLDGHTAFVRPFSPTTLETYATCPQKFFLSKVLRVRRDEEPDELLRISALDRGGVFHAICERFLRDLGRRPQDGDRPQLLAVADAALDQAEADGVTGHPMFWAGDRAAIREDAERWFDLELADEDGAALAQADYEVRFGPSWQDDADGPLSRDTPLTVTLPSGREVHVAGRIDRVDWREQPARFRVIDYKTGKARAKADMLDGGKALQLPLYLLAAAQALDVPAEAGSAEYFYATSAGDYRRVAFSGEALTARKDDLDRVLTELDDGMRTGDFHAEPGDQCKWCEFAGVCDARRGDIRRRKDGDTVVARVAARREDIA